MGPRPDGPRLVRSNRQDYTATREYEHPPEFVKRSLLQTKTPEFKKAA